MKTGLSKAATAIDNMAQIGTLLTRSPPVDTDLALSSTRTVSNPSDRVPYRQVLGSGVPIGNNAASLDRRRAAAVVAEAAAQHHRGGLSGGLVVALFWWTRAVTLPVTSS